MATSHEILAVAAVLPIESGTNSHHGKDVAAPGTGSLANVEKGAWDLVGHPSWSVEFEDVSVFSDLLDH